MKEQLRFSNVQFGPIGHTVLPGDFIERIKAFKKILGDIDSVPIEQTIDNFKRDADPESELVIWERIASTFQIVPFAQADHGLGNPEGNFCSSSRYLYGYRRMWEEG